MQRDRQKVVWYEGMTLDPHHFQQWDRSQQATLNGRLRAVMPNGWGFTEIRIDRERLANGEFALVRCSGILPDGTLFQMPDHEALPPPRPVQDSFSATRERLGVYLALPSEGTNNVLLQGSESRQEKRFTAQTVTLVDENTGGDERPIEIARPEFRILLEGEPLHNFTTLQAASLARHASGTLAVDDAFVPPAVSLESSDRLMEVARRLLELLVAKSLALGERHRNASMQRDLSPGDITALGLLVTINTYIPLVNHHLTQRRGSPESLYTTLLALAGALSAQLPGSTAHPRAFPGYEHGNLTTSFREMDELLRAMLGEATPRANYVRVPLQKLRESLFTASLEQGLVEGAQFFLVARGDGMSEDRLVKELPRMLRIASPATIDDVLRSYTRALTVEHTHRVPVGLPVDQQANYFQIHKRGPFWDAIRGESAIALFLPAEFENVSIEVVAIQP